MGFINSPNMGFPVPTVSTEPGPQYATDVNQALLTLDSHNHSPGQGVPLGAQSLNIQNDLSFNINNAVALRSTRFISTTASSGTDLGCLYVKGVDLFYNDLNANIVRLTLNGGLASTAIFSGQISTTAIVSANGAGAPASSGFIRMVNNADSINWRNAANNADDAIRFDGSDSFHVTGPAFDFKFPTTMPSSTLPLSVASNGSLSIGLLTRPQLPNVGVQLAASSGIFGFTINAFVNAGFPVTLTTSGRPIVIGFRDIAQNAGGAGIDVGGLGGTAFIQFLRNATVVAIYRVDSPDTTSTRSLYYPPGCFTTWDFVPPSSSYTYSTQVKVVSGNGATFNNIAMFAYEL